MKLEGSNCGPEVLFQLSRLVSPWNSWMMMMSYVMYVCMYKQIYNARVFTA